ncbi:hypothetical protein [Williamsia maris]|uniref:Uncharacterized protein n=1 Tax=Williamsia maris TaxID=72806 RepID=A0ABT1HAW0_9NOCA|nr:hypothetical protein [Williamsia maris]MCP2174813.1 hypothetical protein [Williamsia maris]
MTAWLRAAGLAVISRRFRALLSIGMVIGISVVGTLALWSTTVNTQSGVFTTATINIQADASKAASFAFSPTALLPGQSAAKVVAVTNTGTAAFSYSAAVQSSTALGQGMTLTVVAGATATNGVCGTGTSVTTGTAIAAGATTFASNRGPLAATNGVENLCLQLNLPIAAAAGLAGTSGSVLFTFTATAGV